LDYQNGRYTVTTRLFDIIDDLPQEKQFILYKQLVKDKVSAELFKLIIDMSEDQKIQLLEQFGDVVYEDDVLQTVNLDDDESFMRGNPRKICLIPVKCKVEDRTFKSYIIDISKVGAFIESNDQFPVGQKIIISFKLPKYDNAFQLDGRIARSGPKGIGVKFYNLSPSQEDIIIKFIEGKK
jgi:Tfp pilus assembly protein PilZ